MIDGLMAVGVADVLLAYDVDVSSHQNAHCKPSDAADGLCFSLPTQLS